jgi:hypothetical protein
MLPGGHLTQLILTSDLKDPTTLQELAALTSLRDLRLPLAVPAQEFLTEALSALTSLTALLLVNPEWTVQNSIPASIQELVVVQGWTEDNYAEEDREVWGLQLGHLTNLRQLTMSSLQALPQYVLTTMENDGLDLSGHPHPEDGSVLLWPTSISLPTSLQSWTTAGIDWVDPLLQLTQLDHITVTQLSASDLDEVSRLTLLTQLTRFELQQLDWETNVFEFADWSSSTQKLPLYVPRLHVSIPAFLVGVPAAMCGPALGSLTRLSSLIQLQLSGQSADRAAAILTAAAAAGGNAVGEGAWQGTVQELAASLASLSTLQVLELTKVPAVVAAGRAIGPDWVPVVEAVAALPKLHTLQLRDMRLGVSLNALAAAQHLTSLQLSNCQLDTPTAVELISNMQCRSCLQHLTLGVPPTAGRLTAAVLTAIAQHLHQLTVLRMPGSQFSEAAVRQLDVLPHLVFVDDGRGNVPWF